MKITIDEEKRTIHGHGTIPLEELVEYLGKHPYLDDYSLIGTEMVQYYPMPIIQPYTFTEATLTTT